MHRACVGIIDNNLIAVGAAQMNRERVHGDPFVDIASGVENFDET
jgi:hypothetical protein